jgi:hypothetical protein
VGAYRRTVRATVSIRHERRPKYQPPALGSGTTPREIEPLGIFVLEHNADA